MDELDSSDIFPIRKVPIEILNYLLYNFGKNNDIKNCLLVSKIFHVLSDAQLNNIKKMWFDENYKRYHIARKTPKPWKIASSINYEYGVLQGLKEGKFNKELRKQIFSKNAIIDKYTKGTFRKGKLHKKYEVSYYIQKLRKISDGTHIYKIVDRVEGSFNFEHGLLITFKIKYNDKIVDKDTKIKNKIVSILDLDERYKIQLCDELDIDKLVGGEFELLS